MKLTQNKAKVLKKPKYEVHDTQQVILCQYRQILTWTITTTITNTILQLSFLLLSIVVPQLHFIT